MYMPCRFGVCCVFFMKLENGGTVDQNDTYIQNPEYPSPYADTANIDYTVEKVQNGKYTIYSFFCVRSVHS